MISKDFQTHKYQERKLLSLRVFTSLLSNLETALNLEAMDGTEQNKRSIITGTSESMKEISP